MGQKSARSAAPAPAKAATGTKAQPAAAPGSFFAAPALCLMSGAALVAHHVLMGVLAIPFFGGEAFVWGNVLGAFVLSLAAGIGVGGALGSLAGGLGRRPFRLAAIAGALVMAATSGFPRVARFVLDRGPDSPFAPGLTFAAVLAVPGIVLAAIIPSLIRAAALRTGSPEAATRKALRTLALAMAGGVLGLAMAAFGLRHAHDALIWARLGGLGAALMLAGMLGVANRERIAMAAAGAALFAALAVVPSEVKSPEFRAALAEIFEGSHAGRYYALTTPPRVLSGTEVERRLAAARHRLRGNDKKIAILLVVETLKTLGPLNISGVGLRNLMDIYLPPQSKPLVLPFVEKIAGVTSDGRHLRFRIDRMGPDGTAQFRIPGEKEGEFQEFEIIDDFDLTITTSGTNDAVTKLEIGPQDIEKAGTFEFNDTVKTPFRCKNVALWIDACLLAVMVENEADRVIIKASAQASIGKIQTRVIQTVDKTAVQ